MGVECGNEKNSDIGRVNLFPNGFDRSIRLAITIITGTLPV